MLLLLPTMHRPCLLPRRILPAFLFLIGLLHAAPVIDSITPGSGPTQGGTPITVLGSGFGSNSTVTIGVVSAPLSSLVTNSGGTVVGIVVTSPPGDGANRPLVVRTAGVSSNSVPYSYFAPSINTVSPATFGTAGNTILTISGSNFGLSPTVSIGGLSAPLVSNTHSQIICTSPAGQGSSLPAIVSASGQSSPPVLVSYTPPVITSITPTSAGTAGGTLLTLTGSNFGTTRSVTIGGKTATVQSGSHTSAIVVCPAGEGVNQPVVLTTGLQVSNSVSFSYSPPVLSTITATSFPTAGGTLLTLTGSNFGISPAVTVGGQNAPTQALGTTHNQIVCTLPAGEGTSQQVRVTVAGQVANPLTLDYDAPLLTSISPSSGPTSGGTLLTLQGANFGFTGSVSVGGVPAPRAPAGNSHTQLVVSLPPGQGASKDVVVTVGSRSSVALQFDYHPPQITSVSSSSAPTAGGTVITVNGSNFGASGIVLIGGTEASLTGGSYGHEEIVCTLPPGQGTDFPLIVRSGGRDSNPVLFSYDAPEITSITPTSAATSGGTLLTVTGKNFGISERSVLLGSQSLAPTSASHTQIVCALPPGQGANLPVRVSVDGRLSASVPFSYQAPLLTSITPANGPTAGGTRLTLTGSNFGLSASVTIDGQPAALAAPATHNLLEVTLRPGQGTDREVRVSAGGQTGNVLLFDYDPPVIESISAASYPTAGGVAITLNGRNFGLERVVSIGGTTVTPNLALSNHTAIVCPLPPGQGQNIPVVVTVEGASSQPAFFSYDAPLISSVTAGSKPTAGGTTLTVTGHNFGPSPSLMLGGVSVPALSSSGDTEALFTLPAGQGVDLPLVLTAAGRSSAPLLFSYDAPVITGISAATKPTAGGVSLTVTGRNFGLSRNVNLGSASVALFSQASHTQLVFALPAGQGESLPLTVHVAGQASAASEFSYDPPVLNQITPATGPTAGGTLLTLTGSNFGLTPLVLLGSQVATSSGPQDHGRLVVSLPAGGGADLPLKVQVLARESNSRFFSYLPPAITTISPATGPMAGGTPITIHGSNFGTAGTVSIGGKSVSQYASNTHGSIVCTLPPGSGADRPVTVTYQGQTSQTALFSYLTEDFSDWAGGISWNGLDSSPGADPRNTGWKNSLAYVLGVNPLACTGGEIASREPRVHGKPALSRDAQGRLQLSFWHRRAQAHPDLSSVVLFAGGLTENAWQPGSLAPQVEVVDDIWEFRTYTDSTSGPGNRFGRVKVELQQP